MYEKYDGPRDSIIFMRVSLEVCRISLALDFRKLHTLSKTLQNREDDFSNKLTYLLFTDFKLTITNK